MKNSILLSLAILLSISTAFGQAAGNSYRYKKNVQHRIQLPTKIINVPHPNSNEFVMTIKGLSNIKADKYVAIFSLNQAAETAEEVNRLIDKRIKPIEAYIDSQSTMSFYIDMISFVPIYELDLVKKVFNKKTYNEVPKGFEVQKNIHIMYKNPNDLNKIIEVCSKSEIYDIVRVDYFSDSLEDQKLHLMRKAKDLIDKKLKLRAEILNVNFSNYTMQMNDAYTVVYPVEMYTQYQTSSLNKFQAGQGSSINRASKSTTHYYKPYFDKDFDFAVNPIIFEPVIQVMYEIKVKYTPKPKVVKPIIKPEIQIKKETIIKKEVIIVTPTGEMKTVLLN